MRWIVGTCILAAFLAGAASDQRDKTVQDKWAVYNAKLDAAIGKATDIVVAKVESVSIKTNVATNITMKCQIRHFRSLQGTNNWMDLWVTYDETASPQTSCGSRLERAVRSGQNWILFLRAPDTIVRAEPVARIATIQEFLQKR